jgi:hypothetical protein
MGRRLFLIESVLRWYRKAGLKGEHRVFVQWVRIYTGANACDLFSESLLDTLVTRCLYSRKGDSGAPLGGGFSTNFGNMAVTSTSRGSLVHVVISAANIQRQPVPAL